MAAKTGWHRYGTKLRHYHPIYIYRLMTCYCSHIVVIAAVLHCAAPLHIFTPPPIRERSTVMPVCLSASEHISQNCMSHFRQLFMHVTYVRGSILLWRRCDILCTSGFTDDVLLVHNGYAGCMNMRRSCDSNSLQHGLITVAYAYADPPSSEPTAESGAQFTKYLTIYRKIILSLL